MAFPGCLRRSVVFVMAMCFDAKRGYLCFFGQWEDEADLRDYVDGRWHSTGAIG